jgi:DNA-binding CsgD family transcriptional regulator
VSLREPSELLDFAPALDGLSEREREVLRLASIGSTNQEIGAHLGLSVHAVKFHLGSIYRKLGVANRTEAAVVYVSATAGDAAAQAER